MIVDADGLSDEEITHAIESAIATELEVHPSDIEVIYDSETGVATYTITGDDVESLDSTIIEMQQEDFEITTDNISIASIELSTEIIVNVDVSVDA